MDEIERRQEQILAMLERIEYGLLWFLDPMPEDEDVVERRRKTRTKRVDFGDPARLKKLRPKAWTMGADARDAGKGKSNNPYRDTRGGFRNAWFGGWTERDEACQGDGDGDT